MAYPRKVNKGEGTPRPDTCFTCPLGRISNGYVADHYGRDPKIAFINATPTRADALAGKPMTSYKGSFFHVVLRPYGLTWDNVIISSVLRCSYWGKGSSYPIGRERTLAERTCRTYDGVSRDALGLPNVPKGLLTWNPNRFVLTYDFKDARTLEAYEALLRADVAKAMRFVESGHRPLLVQGKEPMELLAPWLIGQGGLKAHRGDWWEGSLPWGAGAATPRLVTLEKPLIAVDMLASLPAPKKKAPEARQMGLFE